MTYIVDFVNSVLRRSNIWIIIYLILNVLIIGGIFSAIGGNTVMGFLVGIITYAISLVVALSPIGEFVLRFQNHCHKITRQDQLNKIEPIFMRVYEKARSIDPNLSTKIGLFMYDSPEVNAFATGRNTICISSGLLEKDESTIAAALAHEFGHISNHDTDLILIVTVGNFMITAIVTIFQVFIWIIGFFLGLAGIVGGDAVVSATSTFTSMLTLIFVNGIMWVWTKIGTLLVLTSSRSNEYEADAFAVNVGYGKELCLLLDSVTPSAKKGLFATLSNSHPQNHKRIAKMQECGVDYLKEY